MNAIARTASLRERYAEDGYLSPLALFDAQTMSRHRAAFNALEAAEGQAKASVGLQARHFDQRFIWELATAPALLDVMRTLMGENILLMSTHFFCKYPEPDPHRFVAWHQDVTYWGLEPPEAHTAWIAIDRSDRENGCMEVIPGSHRRGIVEHARSTQAGNMLSIEQEIPAAEVDASKAAPLELDPGELSIHEGHLMHASRPNNSTRRRCGLAVRYIRPEVRQAHTNSVGKDWRTVLVSGEDRYGHFPAESLPFPLGG